MNQISFMVLAPVISVLIINIFMLIGILAIGYVSWKKMISAQNESAVIKKSAMDRAAKIISSAEKDAISVKETASKRADQILFAAESAASRIIQKSGIMGTQFQESLKVEFQKSLDSQIKAYQKTVEVFENKSEEAISSVENVAKEDIQRYLSNFGKSIAQDEINEHKVIERELREHRDKKIAEIDDYMRKTFPDVLLRSIADTLTKEQHEALILSALKKVKETNFFQHE